MKKIISQTITFPKEVHASLEGVLLTIEGKEGKNQRAVPSTLHITLDNNGVTLHHPRATKKEKKLLNTFAAHIKNMIAGAQKKFVYMLKVCNVHFPMTVAVQNNEVVVKNFLGEVQERRAKILPSVAVKIEKDMIIVSSSNKEEAGQTAANIETATIIKKRDRRVFQDGIFMIRRAGVDV